MGSQRSDFAAALFYNSIFRVSKWFFFLQTSTHLKTCAYVRFQVRWGDHRMSKIVSGPYHDHLLSRFEAEEFDGIKKSGYLKVFPGKLEVNS